MKSKKWLFLSGCAISLMLLGGCNNDEPLINKTTEVQQGDFIVVGDSKSGYFEIPKDFKQERKKADNGTFMTGYGDKAETFAVISMPVNFKGNFQDTVRGLKESYAASGIPLLESKTTVSGRNVTELTYVNGKDHLIVSVIDGKSSPKVLIFSHKPSSKKYKEQILNSFREK